MIQFDTEATERMNFNPLCLPKSLQNTMHALYNDDQATTPRLSINNIYQGDARDLIRR